MAKATPSRNVVAGTIPASRPRNPFGVSTGMPNAGSHQKSERTQRRQSNEVLRNIRSHKQFSDDFSP